MVSFSLLVSRLKEISCTTKRLEIIDLVSDYFLFLIENDQDSIIPSLYLLTGSIYPEYFNREMGIGENLIVQSLSEITGKKLNAIRKEYHVVGDLGSISLKSRIGSIYQCNELSVMELFLALRKISEMEGKSSVEMKKRKMVELMMSTKNEETKFLIRIFEGKLKVGLALKSVLAGLAAAFYDFNEKRHSKIQLEEPKDAILKESSGEVKNENNIKRIKNTKTREEAIEIIKGCYNKLPNLEELVKMILKHNIEELEGHLDVTVGVPLKPMLAQPAKSITKAYEMVEKYEFSCEYKYDGERIQIHRKGDEVYLYSRSSENLMGKYPDLKEPILRQNEKNFILDGEVVAYDRKEKKILSFQQLSTRKRKIKEVRKESISSFFNDVSNSSQVTDNNSEMKNTENLAKEGICVCVFIFDVLFMDHSTLEMSYEERIKILTHRIQEIEGFLMFSNRVVASNVDEMDTFLMKSLEEGNEGVMIKKHGAGSEYLPSKRTFNWIKLKKDYFLGDTFDLMVIGAYFGKGKRTGGYGGFLLASYNESDDTYESISKIGTGFSEEMLKTLSNLKETKKPLNYVCGEIQPDVWIEEGEVWEVQAAGISVSPKYKCGATLNNGKGISLRFPRFIKRREDKKAIDCTPSSTVLTLLDKEDENKSTEDEFN